MAINVETHTEEPKHQDRCPQRGSWRKVTPVGWKQAENAYRPIEGAERWINLDHALHVSRYAGRQYTVISMPHEGDLSVAELPWQIIGDGERGSHETWQS